MPNLCLLALQDSKLWKIKPCNLSNVLRTAIGVVDIRQGDLIRSQRPNQVSAEMAQSSSRGRQLSSLLGNLLTSSRPRTILGVVLGLLGELYVGPGKFEEQQTNEKQAFNPPRISYSAGTRERVTLVLFSLGSIFFSNSKRNLGHFRAAGYV